MHMNGLREKESKLKESLQIVMLSKMSRIPVHTAVFTIHYGGILEYTQHGLERKFRNCNVV